MSDSAGVMVGLYAYHGETYIGQVMERVGPSHWLLQDPQGEGYTIWITADLRSMKFYTLRRDSTEEIRLVFQEGRPVD